MGLKVSVEYYNQGIQINGLEPEIRFGACGFSPTLEILLSMNHVISIRHLERVTIIRFTSNCELSLIEDVFEELLKLLCGNINDEMPGAWRTTEVLGHHYSTHDFAYQ